MKYQWLFLFFYSFAFSQVENNSIKYLSFKLNYPIDSLQIDDVDWKKEKPKCDFKLKGKTTLRYSFHLKNDTIASLYQYKNNELVFQENMKYQSFFMHREKNFLVSNFKIIDFDHDGNEDLLCWVFSNINGNVWTIIYLYDPKQQKLVKLQNTVDHTDIWNDPEYRLKTSTINCSLYGSAFGNSEESSYKLEKNHSVIPLKKHIESRSQESVIDYKYVGEKGKWKLKSKIKSKA